MKIKRLLTRISCLALAGAMLFCTPNGISDYSPLIDMGINTLTASAVDNSMNPWYGGGTSEAKGWGTSGNLAFRIYPASVDDAIEGESRYDFLGNSIYVYPSENDLSGDNFLKYANEPAITTVSANGKNVEAIAIKGANEGVVIHTDTNISEKCGGNSAFIAFIKELQTAVSLHQGGNAGAEGHNYRAVDFLNNKTAASTNAETMTNKLNNLIKNNETDIIYKGYLTYMKNTFGEDTDVVKQIESWYKEQSAYVNSRKIVLIIEPMMGVQDKATGTQWSFVNYYEALKTWNIQEIGGEYRCDIETPNNPIYASVWGANGASWGTNTKNKGYNGTGLAFTSTGLNALHVAQPTIEESEILTNLNKEQRNIVDSVATNHSGWWWLSIANSKDFLTPSQYGVAEGMRFGTNNDDIANPIGSTSYDDKIKIADVKIDLVTAYVSGAATNDIVMENHYKRMAASGIDENYRKVIVNGSQGTIKFDDTSATWAISDYAMSENRQAILNNSANIEYYRSLSPHQEVKNIDAKEIKHDISYRNHQDYKIGNGTETNGKVVTPENISYTKDIANLYKLSGNTEKDFDLLSVTVDVYEGKYNKVTNKYENVEIMHTFVIPAEEFLTEIETYGDYSLKDSYVTSTDDSNLTLYKLFLTMENEAEDGKYTSFVVTYNYNQDNTTEVSFDSKGTVGTHVPQWSLNNEYSDGISGADTHTGKTTITYSDGNVEREDTKDGLVHAHIYAPWFTQTPDTIRTMNYNAVSVPESAVKGNFKNNSTYGEGDKNLYYRVGTVEKNSLPTISSSVYNSDCAVDIVNGEKYAHLSKNTDTCEEDLTAKFDAPFYVKKSATIDKLYLADWVEVASDTLATDTVLKTDIVNNGLGARTSSNMPLASRSAEGVFTLTSNPFYVDLRKTNDVLKVNKSWTVEKNKVTVADSPYDATCEIKNYVPQTKSYTSSGKDGKDLIVEETSKGTWMFARSKAYGRATFIPEVTMLYKNNGQVSTTTVCGLKDRTLDLITYSTVVPNIETAVTASGTVVATDSRALTLRDKIGTSATQVLYGGSDVFESMAYSKDMGLTLYTYALDVDTDRYGKAVISRNITENVDDIVNTFADTSTLNVSTVNDIYRNWGDSEPIASYHSNPSTIELEKGETSLPNTYRLLVKDGKVNRVYDSSNNVIIKRNPKTGMLGCLSGYGQYKSLCDAIASMGLDDLFTKAMETRATSNSENIFASSTNSSWQKAFGKYLGSWDLPIANHWYGEDTSIFVIREYQTDLKATGACTTTFKIPINAGPSTPASSKEYFSNGYGVYVNQEISINVGGQDVTLMKTTRPVNAKPHYIIADVTTDNLY